MKFNKMSIFHSYFSVICGISVTAFALIATGRYAILKTETNLVYSDSTLSAVVFADTDAIQNSVNGVEAELVFERPIDSRGLNGVATIDLLDGGTDNQSLENLVNSLELETKITLDNVGTSYIDEKIQEEQRKQEELRQEQLRKEQAAKAKKVTTGTISFTYDASLAYVNKDNLPERFSKFAPYDDYYKVLKALSQMALGEAGGCKPTEIAATVWCVLNRYDAGYSNSIFTIISAPNQYHGYSPNKGLRKDVYTICEDVLARWIAEKEGNTNVGRVLPLGYNWFFGDGKHNHFRNKYKTSVRWDWSLPTPYDDTSSVYKDMQKIWLDK